MLVGVCLAKKRLNDDSDDEDDDDDNAQTTGCVLMQYSETCALKFK